MSDLHYRAVDSLCMVCAYSYAQSCTTCVEARSSTHATSRIYSSTQTVHRRFPHVMDSIAVLRNTVIGVFCTVSTEPINTTYLYKGGN